MRQTPRSFVVIMEGRRHAEERMLERMTFIAFQAERMAREKRPRLKDYLRDLKPKAPLSGKEIVSAFRSMGKRGASVTVTRLNPKSR